MRGGDLESMDDFRTLARPHKFKLPFHVYFGFYKVERSKRTALYIVFKT